MPFHYVLRCGDLSPTSAYEIWQRQPKRLYAYRLVDLNATYL